VIGAVLEDRGPRSALRSSGVLRAFNDAGVLVAADVHVAQVLGRLGLTDDEDVLLAAALAVRGPRLGHVCVDLATVAETASSDLEIPVDLRALPWPQPEAWLARLAASALVDGDHAPLELDGGLLYLRRYWNEERAIAADLLERAGRPELPADEEVLAEGLARLFPEVPGPGSGDGSSAARSRRGSPDDDGPDLQRLAAAAALVRPFAVIAGGPGTGKTTTIARVLARLDEQALASGSDPPGVALAAPTGKAAARLEEAVREEALRLPVSPETRSRLASLRGTTLHRLLGPAPGNRTRFRRNKLNRLAADVVVIDETSMVSLSLMSHVVEALRPEARLILVGDPEQLASVEAGAVLGDLVGPASRGLRMRPPARAALGRVTAADVPAEDPPGRTPIGDGIVVLRRVHRFGGGIARLAATIQAGDAEGAVGILSAGEPDLLWLPVDPTEAGAVDAASAVRAVAVDVGGEVIEAARAGAAVEAVEALSRFRVLCAHRRGAAGAETWMATVEGWLAAEITGFANRPLWYPGRPLLITANDYSLRLYNGDTGVVVSAGSGRVVAAFERGGEVVTVSPTRLAAVDTVYAMTVHKSQGSQFDTVAIVLPRPDSPVLTRELLYTAVTRARRTVMVVGTPESVVAAVERPIARSSGLGPRLWAPIAPSV
jgi:exodeoxyribonuclease V alpha subunit